jgi:chemotaxis protein MotB
MERQLAAAKEMEGIEADTLREKLAAMEKSLADKEALIETMKNQLMHGGTQLPVELSTMLEDFAANNPNMITFDASRGIVKFKSDLLFEPGSDKVAPAAVEAVKSLCTILNSPQAEQFDIIIAGHTDDIPIGKPETRQKHPTNWYLSAHRAISVLDVMVQNNMSPERLSVRGFGEYRPVEPNQPNKKGNPQNRRVEIYIVAKGM